MRTSQTNLLVELDRSRPRGLRQQVEASLRDAIKAGRVSAGSAVPSTRALAADLGVTRGVVVAAYDQLIAEGYLLAQPGARTVVQAVPTSTAPDDDDRLEPPPFSIDFRPGLPDLELFPRSAWLRATRVAMQTMPRSQLGYVDPRGLRQLRETILEYAGRARGVVARPENVFICDGFGQGFGLVAQTLVQHGHTTIAVEQPGYWGPVRRLDVLGVPVRGIDVDEEGISVDALRRSRAHAVTVTPAHQAPTGAVLSPARRAALLSWARGVDGYVIEDDYDVEYRYDRRPVGALQGLAPDRVIYCGTTSKTLAPGLRIGWVIVPDELRPTMTALRAGVDHFTSTVLQATFDAFVANGDLDRHLRRTRLVYRRRRDAAIASLQRWFPEATQHGVAAGLQVLVTLPEKYDEGAIVREASHLGVRVHPFSEYRTRPGAEQAPGFVLGYGPLTPDELDTGLRLVAEAARRSMGDWSA
jgi:GntR family transcriptional regulator / MocR family aminotransferase